MKQLVPITAPRVPELAAAAGERAGNYGLDCARRIEQKCRSTGRRSFQRYSGGAFGASIIG
jgi:hypothetical protein